MDRTSTSNPDTSPAIEEDSWSGIAAPPGLRRRKVKFESFDDAIRDIHYLKESGYFRTAKWTLGQVLVHLNKTMRIALEGHAFLLPWVARPIAKMVALPLMRRGVQLPGGAKSPPGLLPTDHPDLEHEVQQFIALSATISNPQNELQPYHPLLGKLNHAQWNIMQRWHAAHHLSFLVPKDSVKT